MDIFDFPYHGVTHTYPKGDSFQFGRGYQFNAAPLLPMQRVFRLSFKGLIWYQNAEGVYDPTITPELNMLALLNFYEEKFTNIPFIYPHPIYGYLTVKFSAANQFEVPKSLDGGSGMTDSFDLFLVEQLLNLSNTPVVNSPTTPSNPLTPAGPDTQTHPYSPIAGALGLMLSSF